MPETQVAVVTGGAQGLGAAMCIELLKKGYKVCVADLQEEKGKQFVEAQREIYGAENVEFITCDVTNENDYEGIFKFTLEKFERIDVLVNNAGVILEQNPRKVLEVNLLGPITGCQLALKYMGKSNGGKGGLVINTASIAGFLPFPQGPVYCATKHGVVGLTRSYGDPYHLENNDVVFTAICPSFINTDMISGDKSKTLSSTFDPRKEFAIMSPEYVAQGILKLLEDRINGSTLVITKNGYTYMGIQEEFKDIPLN